MEITELSSIEIDAATAQLLEQVHDEIAKFRAMGEFSAEVRDELARNFLPDRISDTLNIEGVRVNPRLTRAVLDGLAVAETDRYTGQEILNVNDANDLIESEAKNNTDLSPTLLKEIHRRIENELIDRAGSYRDTDVAITGAKHLPPSWADVPDLVTEVCQQLAEFNEDPLVAAAWAHAMVAKIHPFVDGNGRTARMTQDFLLLRAGLLPVGIPISRRSEYYDALEQSDEGNFSSLVTIIANAELTALDKARRVAEAPLQRRARIQRLVDAATRTTRQTEYNQYEVWRRKTEGFVAELTRWLDDLNEADAGVQFRHRTYEIKSFEKWREIRDRGWANNTWILLIDVATKGQSLHKFLFYVRRHRLDWVSDQDNHLRDEVGIFLDESPDAETKFSLTRLEDPYISLREVIFDGANTVVYHEPDPTNSGLPEGVSTTLERNRWESTTDMSLGDVAEQFIEQVMTKFGLID